MEEHKISLVDFVQDDRFELNSYLTFLFIQSKSSGRMMKKGKI